MNPPTDALAKLSPPPQEGERISVRVLDGRSATEVIGFITDLTSGRVTVLDRHGINHVLARADIVGVRRAPVARGRDPLAAPADLLDALADRAGAAGRPWVVRISSLLDGERPPGSVAPWGPTATIGGIRVRAEGEWATLADGTRDTWVAAGWWATRVGARSMQVRATSDAVEADLASSGFVPYPGVSG